MSGDGEQIINLLRDIEQRSRQHAAGLPQQRVLVQSWAGLAFGVSGLKVVAPLDEVSEILHYPRLVTSVPGAKPWVKGVANVRGNLLPIIDFQAFLGGKPIIVGRRSRVLVIRQRDVVTGLLVGDVQGLRHFQEDQRVDAARIEGMIGRYVQSAFQRDGLTWPVLSMRWLVGDEAFRKAAA